MPAIPAANRIFIVPRERERKTYTDDDDYDYYYYYMIYIAPVSRIESEALASLGGEHD